MFFAYTTGQHWPLNYVFVIDNWVVMKCGAMRSGQKGLRTFIIQACIPCCSSPDRTDKVQILIMSAAPEVATTFLPHRFCSKFILTAVMHGRLETYPSRLPCSRSWLNCPFFPWKFQIQQRCLSHGLMSHTEPVPCVFPMSMNTVTYMTKILATEHE
jgi:hypothetical protein